MASIINFVKDLFSRNPQLSPEAYSAYINKLPDSIQVQWKRDGVFIIGNIITDDFAFLTQGKGADDFIDMVNDAVMTIYDIPDDYLKVVKKARSFTPKPEELSQLKNGEILKATIGLIMKKNPAVKVA